MRILLYAQALLISTFLLGQGFVEPIELKLADGRNQTLLAYWPKVLKLPLSWHFDELASRFAGERIYVPNGKTFFNNSDAIITTQAIKKSNRPDLNDLEMLIKEDRMHFIFMNRKLVGFQTNYLTASKGKRIEIRDYSDNVKSHFFQVAYADFNEFYVIFRLLAKSESAFKESGPDFHTSVISFFNNP